MAIKQRWRCEICGYTYNSPMRVSEVLCQKEHTAAELAKVSGKSSYAKGRSGRAVMTLIEGAVPNEPNRKKAAAHGKQELRRA